MDMIKQTTPEPSAGRRDFLKWGGGALLAGGLLLQSCKKDDDDDNTTPSGDKVDLGSGDIGILNYAYALEQLEAAFYTQVVANAAFNSIFTSAERSLLQDIRDHEIVHREFFKAALGGSAIKGLTPDFSSVDFTKKDSILATAKAFEDLGVAAYNGAGKLITNPDYLVLAGKIVSVEARHAAFIREMIAAGSFVGNDVINTNYNAVPVAALRSAIGSGAPTASELAFNATSNNGTEKSKDPAAVLNTAKAFIKETLDASKLPTS